MPVIRFLIADPSQAVQTFIQQQLAVYSFPEAIVRTVATPQAARESAAETNPDFLFTDTFAKEGMSGIGLHKAVQKYNPQCSFAMVGASITADDHEEAAEAGAYFLLAKPFTADAFRKALAKAMAQLAQTHTQIAQHVISQSMGATSAKIVMPDLPHYKPGDSVSYQNRRETVMHVILRRGELVVQLHGMAGLVDAAKLQHL